MFYQDRILPDDGQRMDRNFILVLRTLYRIVIYFIGRVLEIMDKYLFGNAGGFYSAVDVAFPTGRFPGENCLLKQTTKVFFFFFLYIKLSKKKKKRQKK